MRPYKAGEGKRGRNFVLHALVYFADYRLFAILNYNIKNLGRFFTIIIFFANTRIAT